MPSPSQTGRTIRHILHFGNGYAIVYIPPAIRAFLQADIGDAIEYSEEEEFGKKKVVITKVDPNDPEPAKTSSYPFQ